MENRGSATTCTVVPKVKEAAAREYVHQERGRKGPTSTLVWFLRTLSMVAFASAGRVGYLKLSSRGGLATTPQASVSYQAWSMSGEAEWPFACSDLPKLELEFLRETLERPLHGLQELLVVARISTDACVCLYRKVC